MDNEIWLKLIDNLSQILIATGVVITAIGVIITGYLSYKSGKTSEGNSKKIDASADKLNVIGENVDGKMDKLLQAREDAAGARGELKERDTEREHQKDK